MGLGVEEGEGAAPGAAEDGVPFADGEVGAEGFDVADEIVGGVVAEFG